VTDINYQPGQGGIGNSTRPAEANVVLAGTAERYELRGAVRYVWCGLPHVRWRSALEGGGTAGVLQPAGHARGVSWPTAGEAGQEGPRGQDGMRRRGNYTHFDMVMTTRGQYSPNPLVGRLS